MESKEQMNEMLNADALNPDAFNLNAFMKAMKESASNRSNQAKAYIRRQPGFFTPYSSFVDFADQGAGIVIRPIMALLGTAIVASIAAIAAATAVGSLIFAGGAALFGQTDTATTALLISAAATLVACAAVVATIASAVATLFALPVALGQFVFRGISTVVSPLINCCVSHDEEQNLDRQFGEHLASMSI